MDLNQDTSSVDLDGDGTAETSYADANADGQIDTIFTVDPDSGYSVAQHDADDGSRISLVYDPYGVIYGAEFVSPAGDLQQLTGEQVSTFLTDLGSYSGEEIPLTYPQGDPNVITQVPLDPSNMCCIEDVTQSADYIEYTEYPEDANQSVIPAGQPGGPDEAPADDASQSVIPAGQPGGPEDVSQDPVAYDPNQSVIPAGQPGGPDVVDPGLAPQPEPVVVDPSIGDTSDADFWFQQNTNYTCGPASATQIVEDFTGIDYGNENVLANYAAEKGWLGDTGMQAPHLAQLLTDYGVPSAVESNQSWQDVAGYLQEGRSVVMFVDGFDYWPDSDRLDQVENASDDTVNHFVRIVGIDTERQVAILADSGSPNGYKMEVPLGTLEEAWNDVTGSDANGQPTRDRMLIVSTGADPTGEGAGGGQADAGMGSAEESADATIGAGIVANAAARAAGNDPMGPLDQIEGVAGTDLGTTPSGDRGLFSNPRGFAIVPITLAASRIFSAVRRKK